MKKIQNLCALIQGAAAKEIRKAAATVTTYERKWFLTTPTMKYQKITEEELDEALEELKK